MVKLRIPARREASIEQAFAKKVKRDMHGWKTLKLNVSGQRDWPDRLCVGPRLVLIEFKRPGEPLREGQLDLIIWLISCGHDVHICETVDAAVKVLDSA